MTQVQELDEAQQKIIEKVEKLLRLAGKNPNEAEAASATAKAMELLAAYNLDLGMVGENDGQSTKREELATRGGAYVFQRELWGAVAHLNFCIYWNQRKAHRKWANRPLRYPYHHVFVGRTVNVIMTRTMAGYLEATIERLCRDRLRNAATGEVPHTELFSRWAISYRTGASARLVEKLNDRRWELEKEEKAKARDAANAAARSGVSTSTAITIASFAKSERDANIDAMQEARGYGPNWTARQAEERARQAEADREADEEYTRWAKEHPEEARAEEAKARKLREKDRTRAAHRNDKTREREAAKEAKKYDQGAYWSGYDAAKDISIDQQVSDGKSVPKIEGRK